MIDRQTLLDLAARCKAATGPDQELDAAIDLYLSLPEIARRGGVAMVSSGGIHEWYGEGPPASRRNPVTGAWRSPRAAYTASLDAALTLVPDGHDWRVEVERDRHPGAICCPPNAWGTFPGVTMHGAATPALALCAAALRARAEEASHD